MLLLSSKLKRNLIIAQNLTDEIVNAIIGLGEEVNEYINVQKVLISLPMRFDPKISSLEERADLDSTSMDELHGIFQAYEIRIE